MIEVLRALSPRYYVFFYHRSRWCIVLRFLIELLVVYELGRFAL
jgi:hypothetical protein